MPQRTLNTKQLLQPQKINQKQQQPSPQQHTKMAAVILPPTVTIPALTPLQQKPIKIPPLFLPLVADIKPLLQKLKDNPLIKKFNTKITTNNGLRIQCEDIDTYNAARTMLEADGTHLHTHQLPSQRGLRIIAKNIHHSTPCEWIKSVLSEKGYCVRHIRCAKQRFTGKPINLFEIEIQPTPDDSHLSILELKELCNQTVKIERQAKPVDPPHDAVRLGLTADSSDKSQRKQLTSHQQQQPQHLELQKQQQQQAPQHTPTINATPNMNADTQNFTLTPNPFKVQQNGAHWRMAQAQRHPPHKCLAANSNSNSPIVHVSNPAEKHLANTQRRLREEQHLTQQQQ
ncbi:hypothetical protein AWZ03_014874, partial [Drosophila navojoa]